MSELDDELRGLLRRKDPPAGFADRVLRRVTSKPLHQRSSLSRAVALWAAAAVVMIAVSGAIQYRAVQKAHEERVRGEAAKEQVLEAFRITGSKLQVLREKIKEVGS